MSKTLTKVATCTLESIDADKLSKVFCQVEKNRMPVSAIKAGKALHASLVKIAGERMYPDIHHRTDGKFTIWGCEIYLNENLKDDECEIYSMI